MPPIITPERPDTADAKVLIAELEAVLEPFYPRESRHGFSVEKLIAEGVAFFLIRQEGVPAGCGGIQLHGTEYGMVSQNRKKVLSGCQRGSAKTLRSHH